MAEEDINTRLTPPFICKLGFLTKCTMSFFRQDFYLNSLYAIIGLNYFNAIKGLLLWVFCAIKKLEILKDMQF
jgi:hypothetical protein